MTELIHLAMAPWTLPFTVVLGLCLVYWLLMMVGFLEMDAIDAHLDLQGDVHAGDAHIHVDGEAPHDARANGSHHGGGFISSCFEFLNIIDVPVMVVLSILTIFGWGFSMLVNHLFNPGNSAVLGFALLVPNFLLAVVLTHYMTKPFKKLFRSLSTDVHNPVELIGRVCTVQTGEVSNAFGQAEVDIAGASITLNVRSLGDEKFHRGDKVLILEEDKKNRLFKVTKYQEPKIEE